jgi:hypothetical protein
MILKNAISLPAGTAVETAPAKVRAISRLGDVVFVSNSNGVTVEDVRRNRSEYAAVVYFVKLGDL